MRISDWSSDVCSSDLARWNIGLVYQEQERGPPVMTNERPILELHDVSRSFGGINAVSGLSFHVNKGEVLGLIGHNGAGKTKVFNIISGLIPPSSGPLSLNGEDIHGLHPHHVCLAGIAGSF